MAAATLALEVSCGRRIGEPRLGGVDESCCCSVGWTSPLAGLLVRSLVKVIWMKKSGPRSVEAFLRRKAHRKWPSFIFS
jgi:hypothetical protein